MNIAQTQIFRLKESTDSHLRFPALFERWVWVHTYFIPLTKKHSRTLCLKNTGSQIRSSFDLRELFVPWFFSFANTTKMESVKIRDENLDEDSSFYRYNLRIAREIIGIRAKSSRFRNFPGQSATRCSSTCVWRDFIPRSITASSTVTSR